MFFVFIAFVFCVGFVFVAFALFYKFVVGECFGVIGFVVFDLFLLLLLSSVCAGVFLLLFHALFGACFCFVICVCWIGLGFVCIFCLFCLRLFYVALCLFNCFL